MSALRPALRTPLSACRISAHLLAAWIAACACILSPSEGASQLAGTVSDMSGTPLEGVTVEAWGEAQRLATRITDGSGAFRFPPGIAARTTALYAHRLGYRGVRLELEPGAPDPVEIRLDPEAIPLPAVDVVATREFCPREDEPAARALWNAARARYLQGLDSMGVATYLAASREVVSRDRLMGTAPQGAALDQRGSSFLLRVSWRRRIEREGYAYPVRRPTSEGSLDSWVYAPLEADLAPHFADPLFGRLHTLSVLAGDGSGWRIAFCPRDPRRPSIQGTLHLAQDTSLVSADWLFRTPEPSEEAGGQAFFAPVGPRVARFLLPSEGISWRKSPDGGFARSHERFEGWIVAPGDSVPFLPSRREAASRSGSPPR